MTKTKTTSKTTPTKQDIQKQQLTPGQQKRMDRLRTWHTYRASGKLPPSYRVGGRRIWKRQDIERWIAWDFPCMDKFIELSNLEQGKG